MKTDEYYVRRFLILMAGACVASVGIVPYATTMFGPLIDLAGMSTTQFAILVFLQSLVSSAVCAFLGLKLSTRTGLGTPMLSHLLDGKALELPKAVHIRAGLLWGSVVGVVLIVADLFIFPETVNSVGIEKPGALSSLLASFYGGISEEIIYRLFGVNVGIWLVMKVRRSVQRKNAVWIAILLSGLIFGMGHIVNAGLAGTLDSMFIVRVLVLNGFGSVVFGVVYWRYSLLAAMGAHFIADLYVHILLPAIT